MQKLKTPPTPAVGSSVERPCRPQRVQNDTGETVCFVRYMVETEAGWLGAWDESAFGAYAAAAVAAERERVKAALIGMDDAAAGKHNYYAHAAWALFDRA